MWRYLYKKQELPHEITLEITYRCNINCPFCFNEFYVDKNGIQEELDTVSIKKIIDKIKASRIRIIRFTGGEPLLREDIFELMDYAYSQGLKIWLNTNATLINRQNVGIIVRTVERVLISLNGFSSESEKKITGREYFRKKLKGILLLKKHGIRHIRFGTVAKRHNIENLEKIYALVERLDVDGWELYRELPASKDARPLDNSDIKVLVDKLIVINRHKKNKNKISNALPFCSYNPRKINKVSIGAIGDDGHNRLVVDSAGFAKPMYYLTENLGNVLNEDVLSIWNRTLMKHIRNLKMVPKICHRCPYIKKCKGGSRFVSKIVGGSYKALDYLAQPDLFFRTVGE